MASWHAGVNEWDDSLESIFEQMEAAVPAKDVSWMGRSYRHVVNAKDIIEWLVASEICQDRQDAVKVGRALQKAKNIVHIWGSHTKLIPFNDRSMLFHIKHGSDRVDSTRRGVSEQPASIRSRSVPSEFRFAPASRETMGSAAATADSDAVSAPPWLESIRLCTEEGRWENGQCAFDALRRWAASADSAQLESQSRHSGVAWTFLLDFCGRRQLFKRQVIECGKALLASSEWRRALHKQPKLLASLRRLPQDVQVAIGPNTTASQKMIETAAATTAAATVGAGAAVVASAMGLASASKRASSIASNGTSYLLSRAGMSLTSEAALAVAQGRAVQIARAEVLRFPDGVAALKIDKRFFARSVDVICSECPAALKELLTDRRAMETYHNFISSLKELSMPPSRDAVRQVRDKFKDEFRKHSITTFCCHSKSKRPTRWISFIDRGYQPNYHEEHAWRVQDECCVM